MVTQQPATGDNPPQAPGEELGDLLFWDLIVADADMPLADKIKWMIESYEHVSGILERALPPADRRRLELLALLYQGVFPMITNPAVTRDPLAGQQALEWMHCTCNLLWDLLPADVQARDEVAHPFLGDNGPTPAGRPTPASIALAQAMGERMVAFAAGLDDRQKDAVVNATFQMHNGAVITPTAAQTQGHTGDLTMESHWHILRHGAKTGEGDANFCNDPACPVCRDTLAAALLGPQATPLQA